MPSEVTPTVLSQNNMGPFFESQVGGVAGLFEFDGIVQAPGAQSPVPTVTDYESVPTPPAFNTAEGIGSTQASLTGKGETVQQQGTPSVNGPTLVAAGAVLSGSFYRWE